MKNKFFVCIELLFGFIFLFVSGAGAFTWFAIDAFGEDMFVTVLLTIMLVVLPTILLFCGIWLTCSVIKVNEYGITKRLFGLMLKSYKWEEISEIKTTGNFVAQTVSFYKIRKEKAPLCRWIKKERIFFYCNNKKMTILQQYAPEHILRQLCL